MKNRYANRRHRSRGRTGGGQRDPRRPTDRDDQLWPYREQADYGGRTEFRPCSGREAYYQRYASVSSRLVMADGAKILWFGDVLGRVIGPPRKRWDDALLVEYPSFGTFSGFCQPEYQAAVIHRTTLFQEFAAAPATTSTADGPRPREFADLIVGVLFANR